MIGAEDTITVGTGGSTPTVTLAANDKNASETGPDNGQFTVTRTGSTSGTLAVYYSIAGTATNTSDYSTLSGTVTIASGSSTAVINVAPIDDSLIEGNGTVILTLSGDAGYTIGSPSNNTVTIADNNLPTVTITATDPNAAEQGQDPGTYTVTRSGTYQTGDMTDLVVYYAISGTASNVNGVDYTLSGTVGQPDDHGY